jgi:succinyl-diaminopimelate desuccinylase
MWIATMVLAATVSASPKAALQHYEKHEAKQLVPLLTEVLRYPTHVHDAEAHLAQKEWLRNIGTSFSFVVRERGKITEIELPGPKGAPVLGLVIHGDVVLAEADAWSFPPFAGLAQDGYVLGRGAADDKGPLVQALLAMRALRESGVPRTHTIRLLVGSEEESSATEMAEYLVDHPAPDYSLVLDSEFPVVVGEKAWDGIGLVTPLREREGNAKPYRVKMFDAGLSPSIVPDRAELQLVWVGESVNWDPFLATLQKVPMPEGTRLAFDAQGEVLRIVAYGKSAHAGVNLRGGRNALVGLAHALEGKLPEGGANDILTFVRLAGKDLHGTGLGITDTDPLWGRFDVNIGTVKAFDEEGRVSLYINLRRTPPRTGAQMRTHLETFVKEFNAKQGSQFTIDEKNSYFADEPLRFDPEAKLVKRLMAAYTRATGEKARPAISGGGTYAKRLPNAIAFGMWFPGKPYPGHDVDEKIAIADLHRGARVLIHALVDLATGAKIEAPFAK